MRTTRARWTTAGTRLVLAGLGIGAAAVAVVGCDGGGAGAGPGDGDGHRGLRDGRTSVVAVYGEIGVWDGSRWVGAGEAWEPSPPGVTYQRVGVTGAVTLARSEVASGRCLVADEAYLRVDVGQGIAVAGVDDPRPRVVELLASAADHRAAVRDAVAGLGEGDPAPDVHQVVRADLDGDGTDEVLVAARRRTGDGAVAPPGDYGVVVLVDGDGGPATVVDAQVSTVESPVREELSVGAVADLNGDGRMEVVVNRGYRGTATVTVHELGADGRLHPVLAGGCGL